MTGFRLVQKLLPCTRIFSKIAGNQRGGVLLFLLVAVTVLGLSAGIAGSTWTSIVQRAKEADLLWKGNQIRMAIGKFYETAGAPGTPLVYPQSVEDLLQDNRTLTTRRHLRQPYIDPMTGEDWEWIKAPEGGFKGVRSTSKKTPFKKDGFSEENKTFAGMYQYLDWEFIYLPKKKVTPKPSVKSPVTGSQPTGTPQPPAGN